MNILDWNSLAFAEKIFTSIGLLSLVLVVLQIILSFLGGEVHDYDVHADGDGHSWGKLSIRGLFGFMLGLGWVGLIVLQHGGGVVWATLAGASAGFVIASILALMMKAFHSMRSDGTVQLSNTVGLQATVYQRIPATRAGFGKVQIVVQERMQTLEACTDDASDIAPQSHVVVTEVVSGSLLLVKRA